MEHSRTLEIKVGLAVGVAVFLFILSLFMLGGDGFLKPTYRLYVKFDSVQGLGPGSVVQLLGIPVGNVSHVEVSSGDTSNNISVALKIDKSFQNQITDGSIAGVRTQGALGDKFIFITPGNPKASPLGENSVIQTESKGGFIDTLVESGDKLEKAFEIIDEFHALMKNINGQRRSELLMSHLASASENLSAAAKDFRKATGHMSNILEKIDNGTGTMGALINDRSVFDGLKRFVGSPQENYMKNVIRETIK